MLMISMVLMHDLTEMPSERRPPGQMWLSLYREAQPVSILKFSQSAFNVTASFSRSTDLYLPYAWFLKQSFQEQNLTSMLAEKRLPILWAVSHCKTTSRREDYVTELSKYIDVDIIGKCGNKTLCDNESDRTAKRNCERDQFSKYYFYLAFENNICEDYITEKVFSRMKQNMVPIVLGGGHYIRDLPPNSFIDINNFESPKHLTAYLRMLIATPTKYAAYHEWRHSHVIGQPDQLCIICEYMNSHEGGSRVIPDVNDVFGVSQCQNASDYYKNSFNVSKYD